MEKSFTKDSVRWFTCKRCGLRNYEPLKLWKKKPQSMKNVCVLCDPSIIKEKKSMKAKEYFGRFGNNGRR